MRIATIKTRPSALQFKGPSHWAGRVDLGGLSLGDRPRDSTVALMESHVPRSLPDRVRQEIEKILQE